MLMIVFLLGLFAVFEHVAITRHELRHALNLRLSYFAITFSKLMPLLLITFADMQLICIACMVNIEQKG